MSTPVKSIIFLEAICRRIEDSPEFDKKVDLTDSSVDRIRKLAPEIAQENGLYKDPFQVEFILMDFYSAETSCCKTSLRKLPRVIGSITNQQNQVVASINNLVALNVIVLECFNKIPDPTRYWQTIVLKFDRKA